MTRPPAWKLRTGFSNISKPNWSLPRLTQERGKWAAGVKAYFRARKERR